MFSTLKSRRLLIRRSAILLLSVFFSYIILSACRNHASTKSNGHEDERTAVESSVFKWIEKRQQRIASESPMKRLFGHFLPPFSTISNDERVLLAQISDNKISKRNKCRYVFEVLYKVDPKWDNVQSAKFHNIDELDNTLISLLGERLRTYDYCFLSGELDPAQIFQNSAIDPFDLQKRMFPFLKRVSKESDVMMWPIVTDLSTGESVPNPQVDMESSKFNGNFWSNWRKLSSGRGFVLTMSEKDVPLFLKQLKVMEFLKNVLPFQIITTGNDLSLESIGKISKIAKEVGQKVYLIDCSTMLDSEFSKAFISFFQNKWVATLFNTFKEFILLDADVVPFVKSDYFFNSPSYKRSGILLFKDRVMQNEHTFDYCVEMLSGVEPSGQEHRLISSKLIFDSSLSFSSSSSEEASVYYNFFEKLQLHHVDSGLVVVNKREK
ncbi:alpha-1,3-mannosyltransferase mnt3 [Saccharomyces pastorianus]|nr:alpha-1,3-mannosyltransferase mnt3 [Saccharomyces pastorianus]